MYTLTLSTVVSKKILPSIVPMPASPACDFRRSAAVIATEPSALKSPEPAADQLNGAPAPPDVSTCPFVPVVNAANVKGVEPATSKSPSATPTKPRSAMLLPFKTKSFHSAIYFFTSSSFLPTVHKKVFCTVCIHNRLTNIFAL